MFLYMRCFWRNERKREGERVGEGEEGNPEMECFFFFKEMECFNAKITCQNTLNMYHSFDVSFISVSWSTVALFTGRS